jgi:hypothetical protein
MITHQLNHEEILNLLEEQKYSFSDTEVYDDHSILINREDSVYAYITTVPSDYVVIPKRAYDSIIGGARGLDYTPMYFVGTSAGIYAFNLELLKLDFERYTSDDGSFDDDIAELSLTAGSRILEWYPDFKSEEEYLDSLMGDAEPSQWDESDTW